MSVAAADPDGVAGMTLRYAPDGGAAAGAPMTLVDGRYAGQVPGAPAGTLVQIWVEGVDTAGATSAFPAGGPASRALYRVEEPAPAASGLHSLRVLLAPADDAWLFAPENLMSNDYLPATVIWDDREAFYDVGVRLKGSERGRPVTARVGYSIRFGADAPFHGVCRSVMVDRSEGVGFGQREVLLNLMMAHAGAPFAQYSDLVRLATQRPELDGPAELQLTRYEDRLLDFQFASGGDGPLYEYEYVYYPITTTDGLPTSPKLPQPDEVVGTSLRSLGDDREAYRWVFLLKNNRWRDDWDDLMAFAAVFGEPDPEFLIDAPTVIDVDEWLRTFALATLSGTVDQYGNGDGHNAMFYVRPEDHRVLYFAKDLDFFNGSPDGAVVASPDLARLLEDPANARAFYGHLLDILQTSYSGDYMAPWSAQLGALLPGQDFAGHQQFLVDRAAWVLDGAPDSVLQAIPQLAFAITTNGGADLTTASTTLLLEGQAWVDVHSVRRAGQIAALPLTWSDPTHWQTTLTLTCGANAIDLEAVDRHGATVAADSLVATVTCP